MGPRSGSPATETPRARVVSCLRAAARGGKVFFFFLALGLPVSGWAASVETSHNVTVIVIKPELSISDDTGNFTLRFDDRLPGAQSSSRQVNYQVRGNSLPSSSLTGVVSASVEGPSQGIQFKADVGSFTNNGTEGNILLHGTASGEQMVGKIPVPLANKDPTGGTQAGVLNGTVPVTWKASSTQGLSSGQYQYALVVTIKDS